MRARMGSIYVKLLTELGRAEEACRIAPMYSKSFKLDTLQAHATCLALTNREAEAEKLALKGAKSYKTIFHLHAIVYALLLKRGRGQEIKELKKEHLGTISHDDMRFFAKFFRKIFVNENPAKVNSAVKSMSGISWKKTIQKSSYCFSIRFWIESSFD